MSLVDFRFARFFYVLELRIVCSANLLTSMSSYLLHIKFIGFLSNDNLLKEMKNNNYKINLLNLR